MKLSFVIPCYRSEKTIKMVVEEIVSTVSEKSEYEYEIILVNDSSPDNVLSVIIPLIDSNNCVRLIDLMGNYGKDSAVMAGLSIAVGDIAVVMDDDYQCPAKEIWRLINPILHENYDVSAAYYDEKKESSFKKLCSMFYQVAAESMLGQPKEARFDNFIAISKKVYQEMLNYRNPYPFLDGLILRVTKKIAMVEMQERYRGDDNSTGYTFFKSFKMFLNGVTTFSVKPLRVATILGSITALFGLIYMVFTVIYYFISPEAISEGYSSLLSVILFIGGMVMIMLGIIGEYIGRIYICINQSPQYIIRKIYN